MRLADRVLECLYDRNGEFVWLDELAGTARPERPDRAGLERALEELAARGHRIERVPLQGVRLLRPTVLDAHLIERDIPAGASGGDQSPSRSDRRIGGRVICFREVGSTNDVAFASAKCRTREPEVPLVVTAEHQTAGRGRLGRKWLSQPGTGILASVLLKDPPGAIAHEALTIAAGLAVAEGLEQSTGVRAGVEWPNDVVVGGAKLAGVLVEIRGVGGRGRIVVGFGVNVSAAPRPEQVARAVTCLAEAAGDPSALERIEILRAVLAGLDRWVDAIRAGRTGDLHDRWLARCAVLNRRLTVACAGRRHVGRVVDVDPLSGLILLSDTGRRVRLPAATSTIVE